MVWIRSGGCVRTTFAWWAVTKPGVRRCWQWCSVINYSFIIINHLRHILDTTWHIVEYCYSIFRNFRYAVLHCNYFAFCRCWEVSSTPDCDSRSTVLVSLNCEGVEIRIVSAWWEKRLLQRLYALESVVNTVLMREIFIRDARIQPNLTAGMTTGMKIRSVTNGGNG